MVELNFDVMSHIVKFLDPANLSKMASVNKSWKIYIQRNKIWKPFIWKCSTPMRVLGITGESHHFGGKRTDCFWGWILRNYVWNNGGVIPLASLRRLWANQGKPCIILRHHRPDTCFMYPISATDKQDFLKKYIVYGDGSKENAFTQYIKHCSKSVWGSDGGLADAHWSIDINSLKTRFSDLEKKAEIANSAEAFECKLIRCDIKNLEEHLQSYRNSYKILEQTIHSSSHTTSMLYEKNDKLLYTEAINGIIFSTN
jgi:hypothetical protein